MLLKTGLQGGRKVTFIESVFFASGLMILELVCIGGGLRDEESSLTTELSSRSGDCSVCLCIPNEAYLFVSQYLLI